MVKSGYESLLSDINGRIKSLRSAVGPGALLDAVGVYNSAKPVLGPAPASQGAIKSYVAAKSALERLEQAMVDYMLKDGRSAVKAAYKAAGIKEDFSGKPKLPPGKAGEVISSAERHIEKLRKTFNSSGLGAFSTNMEFDAFDISLGTLRKQGINSEHREILAGKLEVFFSGHHAFPVPGLLRLFKLNLAPHVSPVEQIQRQ